MKHAARKWRRHRWMKLLVPAFILVSISMVPLNSVFEREHVEIFPFFRWKLFTTVPDWETSEYALIVHTVDSNELRSHQYLVPNESIRDWKAVRTVGRACRTPNPCDGAVDELVVPIVKQRYGDSQVEFSIVKVKIDLRGIQADMDSITEGTKSLTEFLSPESVIGVWTTGNEKYTSPSDPTTVE